MMKLNGKTVSEGIAAGRIKIYRKNSAEAVRAQIEDTEAEIARFEQAKESAKRNIAIIHDKALEELGEAGAAIFEVHQMLLDDLNFVESVTELIEQEKVSAEYAVTATCGRFSAMFEAMDNGYMQARAADVRDIGSQVIANLRGAGQAAEATERSAEDQAAHDDGRKTEEAAEGKAGDQATHDGGRKTEEAVEGKAGDQAAHDDGRKAAEAAGGRAEDQATHDGEEPVILMAEDLAPSETVRLDKSRILALVTRRGSVNSHTAILARTMRLPALTGVEIDAELDGHMAIVDGYAGLLLIDPDEAELEKYQEKQREEIKQTQLLAELRDRETVTKDGRKVRLCANIGGVDDAEAALQDGADGIGLFRSEYLYLGKDDFPTEEEQFEAYRAVAERMAGKEVVVRTLDIGSDKCADYFHLPKEKNPALGLRGIRVGLKRPELLRTQLCAILRASRYGNVSVMYPMIISVEEIRRAKQIMEEAKAELAGRNIPYGEVRQGIMIETPAAAWLSDELAKEVDFFSIGTNDLTQYMLAADRQDPGPDVFYDPHHPAVLGAVRTVVKNGHRSGIRVGICGELAADTALTEEFLRMGVDELSVGPAHILPVRAAVRACAL